jgi:hypothetical protein
MADGRVTQDIVEVLSQPIPDARLSQVVIEILSANVAPVVVTERVEPFVWLPM